MKELRLSPFNFEHIHYTNLMTSQLAFTCSKSTMKTPEQYVKSAKN